MHSENITNAPIALFTYKRLNTLPHIIEGLLKNPEAKQSQLYIFSDAAKLETDQAHVKEVRKFVDSISGFKSVTINYASSNKGLASSIIEGVTHVLEKHDKIIVLEDDLQVTPNFLCFMNASLHNFQHTENVFSISGYSFALNSYPGFNADAYFLNRGWSWGWATWKNRWLAVDWSVNDYASFSKDIQKRKSFSAGGSDLNSMLRKQMNGRLDSWAIRWFYAQWKINGLTLYPLTSKIKNNGFDSMATHTKGSNKRFLPNLDTTNKREFLFPKTVELTMPFQLQFQKKMGLVQRVKSRLANFFYNNSLTR